MHVLITADTVGGVWTYTQELVNGLVRRGVRVTLVSLGKLPRPEQTSWTTDLEGLDYRPTAYRLEWMENAERDVEESTAYLDKVIREVRPDVLHFNQYCYGSISAPQPRIVVAHSDVVSWWVSVHQQEPDRTPRIGWYRDTVERGLSGAQMVVAPSQWMLDTIVNYYAQPKSGMVIYNGRTPELFDADLEKENFVLSVGRLWDRGKQVSVLLDRNQAAPICVVGCGDEPRKQAGSEAEAEIEPMEPQLRGERSQEQLRELYGRAAMYAATSCYEPFGLAPLEAAFSRCALILNDIPVFHELWGDSAHYFRRNDPEDLEIAIRVLNGNPELRKEYGDLAYRRAQEKFRAEAMVDQYEQLYQSLQVAQRAA